MPDFDEALSRRGLLGAAILGAALPAASALAASPARLRSTQPARKPFVLVHGAWHGGWCWKKLVPLLCEAGHPVYTPTLTGVGDRSHLLTREVDLATHVRDVVELLE